MSSYVLNNLQSRKKVILKVSTIFIVILVLLTFFSNTINNFSLPRVLTEQPINGALIREVTGEGVVEAKELKNVYVDQGRLVEKVAFKTGDTVKKGQVIIVLNKDELERQLKEELLIMDQMKLKLEKLKNGILPSDIDNNGMTTDLEQIKVNDAQEKLDNAKELYEAGAISKEELNTARNELLSAKKELSQKLKDQKNTQLDIKDQEDSIKLEQIKIDELRKKINEGSTLYAPIDGVISEMNAVEGTLTSSSTPIFSIANMSKGFEMRAAIDKDKAKYLSIGDEVEVNIKSLGEAAIIGTLIKIEDNAREKGEKKDLIIELPQKGLSGGEQGEIYISKKTNSYKLLVSNSAIGSDKNGKFVWVLKKRDGLLGDEFYVQRAGVTVGDSDSTKTIVVSGSITNEDYIVVKYSKNLSNGSRVMPEK